MKQLVSIILCLTVLMSLEKGWAQDIDNIKPTEPFDSKTKSIINSVSEFGVNIKNMFISPPDPLMDLKKQRQKSQNLAKIPNLVLSLVKNLRI